MSFKVLFAEDEEAVRKNYALSLSNYFESVYEVSNGEMAIQVFEEKMPDLIIMDINLPKVNGLSVIEHIRKKDQEIPIIILSAYSDKEYLFQAIKLNLFEYLVKPIERSRFKEVISNVIAHLRRNEIIELKNDFKWNKSQKILSYQHTDIKLTKSESLLLETLLSNPHKAFSAMDLHAILWQDNITNEFNAGTIRNIINQLRKKSYTELIINSYGEGYKIYL